MVYQLHLHRAKKSGNARFIVRRGALCVPPSTNMMADRVTRLCVVIGACLVMYQGLVHHSHFPVRILDIASPLYRQNVINIVAVNHSPLYSGKLNLILKTLSNLRVRLPSRLVHSLPCLSQAGKSQRSLDPPDNMRQYGGMTILLVPSLSHLYSSPLFFPARASRDHCR